MILDFEISEQMRILFYMLTFRTSMCSNKHSPYEHIRKLRQSVVIKIISFFPTEFICLQVYTVESLSSCTSMFGNMTFRDHTLHQCSAFSDLFRRIGRPRRCQVSCPQSPAITHITSLRDVKCSEHHDLQLSFTHLIYFMLQKINHGALYIS
jgi:hypothetical protein